MEISRQPAAPTQAAMAGLEWIRSQSRSIQTGTAPPSCARAARNNSASSSRHGISPGSTSVRITPIPSRIPKSHDTFQRIFNTPSSHPDSSVSYNTPKLAEKQTHLSYYPGAGGRYHGRNSASSLLQPIFSPRSIARSSSSAASLPHSRRGAKTAWKSVGTRSSRIPSHPMIGISRE